MALQKDPAKVIQSARAGAVELAGVGIALSVYGTVTKLFNVPLLSVATSSVATALGDQEGEVLPSHSITSALMLHRGYLKLPAQELCCFACWLHLILHPWAGVLNVSRGHAKPICC